MDHSNKLWSCLPLQTMNAIVLWGDNFLVYCIIVAAPACFTPWSTWPKFTFVYIGCLPSESRATINEVCCLDCIYTTWGVSIVFYLAKSTISAYMITLTSWGTTEMLVMVCFNYRGRVCIYGHWAESRLEVDWKGGERCTFHHLQGIFQRVLYTMHALETLCMEYSDYVIRVLLHRSQV